MKLVIEVDILKDGFFAFHVKPPSGSEAVFINQDLDYLFGEAREILETIA